MLCKVRYMIPFSLLFYESIGGVHISLFKNFEPVGSYTTTFVACGHCVTRHIVTFPALEHHRPLTGTKLYCSVTEAHRCK